jgi:hypothetical protein
MRMPLYLDYPVTVLIPLGLDARTRRRRNRSMPITLLNRARQLRPAPRLFPLMALLALLGCGGARELEEYDNAVVEGARCSGGDVCVMAGGIASCRCPAAVRSDAAAGVAAVAERTQCPDDPPERLFCPEVVEARCVSSICSPIPDEE